MSKLPARLKSRWGDFVAKIKQSCQSEEEPQLPLEEFERICAEFGIKITDFREIFCQAFPGKVDGDVRYIDMSHLNELQFASKISNLLDHVDLPDDESQKEILYAEDKIALS